DTHLIGSTGQRKPLHLRIEQERGTASDDHSQASGEAGSGVVIPSIPADEDASRREPGRGCITEELGAVCGGNRRCLVPHTCRGTDRDAPGAQRYTGASYFSSLAVLISGRAHLHVPTMN